MALPCVGKFENYFRHENSHRHMWPNDMQRMVSHLRGTHSAHGQQEDNLWCMGFNF